MENYKIFYPKDRKSFAVRIEELEATVGEYINEEKQNGRRIVYSKVFLSDIRNQNTMFSESALYNDLLAKAPCSIVGQAPLCGSKIAVLVKTSDLDECFRLHSLRLSEEEAEGHRSYMQTMMLFEKYINYMEAHGLDMSTHLVRTWIYIADIDVNYAGVVKARNDIFERYGLTADNHYIASTGIGGDSQSRHACAPEYLNPTHEYGVAFERATRLTVDNVSHYYVSGTASIDNHGDVLYLGDVERQTYRLLENVEALLAEGDAKMSDIRYFIVYLRDISDYEVVDAVFSSRFPSVPYVIVHGKVCRPEWLVEAECIAEK